MIGGGANDQRRIRLLSFQKSAAGSYVLRVEMDEGDTLTFRFGAPLGEMCSDVDPQTGLSDVIRLQSGERRLNVDIG